jgi:predicted transcriptional regulator
MNAHTDFEQYVANSWRAMRYRELSRGSIDDTILQILQKSHEPMSQTSIAALVAHCRDAVAQSLARLVDAGKVSKDREPKGNRKRFLFSAVAVSPIEGVTLPPDEATVMAIFADGRCRTINDVANRAGRISNPLGLVLRRLLAKGLIKSFVDHQTTIYEKT